MRSMMALSWSFANRVAGASSSFKAVAVAIGYSSIKHRRAAASRIASMRAVLVGGDT
jgi:hypothetical protein